MDDEFREAEEMSFEENRQHALEVINDAWLEVGEMIASTSVSGDFFPDQDEAISEILTKGEELWLLIQSFRLSLRPIPATPADDDQEETNVSE
jgi:hypothetical protein